MVIIGVGGVAFGIASCTSRAAFCKDEEKDRIMPKKSSGLGASGEAGSSP